MLKQRSEALYAFWSLAALAAFNACRFSSEGLGELASASGSSGSNEIGDPPSGSTGAVGEESSGGDVEAAPSREGLPCEIEDLLAQTCRACHGTTLAGGAPNRMLSVGDLRAPSLTQPGRIVAEVAVDRMRDAERPMPPTPSPRVDEGVIADWAAWVLAGTPASGCDDELEPTPDPFDVPPTCTSDEFWTEGLFEDSPAMNPGRACIACHADPEAFGSDDDDDEGPRFIVAGTVFPTAHEPDDCNGVDGVDLEVRIEVRDGAGQIAMVGVNRVGNFFADGGDLPHGFAPPFQIRLVAGENERRMAGAAPTGDCNTCHTQAGANGAPGRILLP